MYNFGITNMSKKNEKLLTTNTLDDIPNEDNGKRKRQLCLSLLDEISDKDFKRIRFFLKDVVTASPVDNLFELIRELRHQGCENGSESSVLHWVLEAIYLKDLGADLLFEINKDIEEQSRCTFILSPFRQLLLKLDCKLGYEDIQRMKFLVADILPAGVLEPINSALELFEILEHRGNLSVDDLSLLKWLLDKSPRRDLLPMLEKGSSILIKNTVPKAYGLRKLPVDYVERQSDVEYVKKLLRSRQTSVGVVDTRNKGTNSSTVASEVVGIRGMGGIGKTVLAQAVCWQIKDQRQVIWLTVGQSPDLLSLLNTLASVVAGQRVTFSNQAVVQNWIREKTADRDCVVVLDDVWDVNHAAAFDVMDGSCQLLVTTRNTDVIRGLRSSQLHKLGTLKKKQARELLVKSAQKQLSGLSQQVRKLVEEILQECDGLPLALALVGSSLVDACPDSPVEWQDRLEGLREADLKEIQSCFPTDSYPYENILAAIEISFRSLPIEYKEKFLNFAIFPEDIEIPSYVLEMVWKIPGRKARSCLSFLERRSLLQSGTKEHCYVVHDILLDYVRGRLRRERNDFLALQQAHTAFLNKYREKCQNGKWSNGPRKDEYFFQYLAFHLAEAGKGEELEGELLSFDWLKVKLEETDLASLLADFRYMDTESKEKEEIKLLRTSLMLSSNIVSSHKDQLGGQMLGRLKGYTSNPKIKAILTQAMGTTSKGQSILPFRWCLTPPGGPLMRTIDGRSRTILSFAVTPDIKKIFTGGADASIKLWDYETGKELQKLQGHTKMVYAIALSFNADILVSGSFDNTVKVWDMDTMQEVVTLSEHKDWVSGVLITPDTKKILSSSYDSTIMLWDLEHCALEHTFVSHEGHVRGIALTPDGRRFASASQDKTVKIWNLKTLEIESTLRGHLDTVYCVYISPDGKFVISGSEDTLVKIWDIESATEVRSLTGHTSDIFTVSLTPDGKKVVSAGDDTTIKVWSFETGEELATLRGHSESIRATIVSQDGRAIISGSEDRTYKLWDIDSIHSLPHFMGHTQAINSVAISQDGSICVTASGDSLVKVWDCEHITEAGTLSGHVESVLVVTLHPNSLIAASGGHDCTVKIWDLNILTERVTLKGHEYPVQALEFGWDGSLLVSGSKDNSILIWDWRNEVLSIRFKAPIYDIIHIAVSAESVLACNRKHICWQQDIVGAKHSQKPALDPRLRELLETGIVDCGSCTDTRTALESATGSKAESEIRVGYEKSDAFSKSEAIFSPDNMSTDSVTFSGPDSRPQPALIIRDGARLLLGSVMSKCPLRCLDVETGMDIGHCIDSDGKALVTALAATTDGKEVLVGTDQGTVVRLELDSDSILQVYKPEEGVSPLQRQEITAIALTSDNEFFLAGCAGGDIVQWAVGENESRTLKSCECRINDMCSVFEDIVAACDGNGNLHVFSVKHSTGISVYAHECSAHTVAYNETAGYLVTGSDDRSLKMWKVNFEANVLACDEDFQIHTPHDGGVKAVGFAPDGESVFSASCDNTVIQWDLNSGNVIREFQASSFGVNYIHAVNDQLVACFDDCTTVAWSIKDGEILRTILGHWGRFRVIDIFPQGDRAVSDGFHYTLKCWKLGSGSKNATGATTLPTYQHSNEITAVSILPSGSHLITGSRDKILRLWMTESGECVSEFYFEHIPRTIACIANGRVCIGLSNGQVSFMEISRC